jgi:steroid delta-isomerase-like uncharacterized protein
MSNSEPEGTSAPVADDPEVEAHGLKEVVSVGVAVAALAGSAAGTAAAADSGSRPGGADTALVASKGQESIDLARSYFEQVWNGDFAGGEQLAAGGYGIFGPQADAGEQSGCQKRIGTIVDEYRAGFPDLRFEIHNVTSEGDTVTIDWVATGTQRGTFWGVEPTGLPVKVPGWTTYTLRDGQITQEVYGFDVRSVFEQIGAGR